MSQQAISWLRNVDYRLVRTDEEKYAALALRNQFHSPIAETQSRLLEECRDNCCFLVIAILGDHIIGVARMHEHPMYMPKGIMLDCLTIDRLYNQPVILAELIQQAMSEAANRGYTKCFALATRAQELLVLQGLGFRLESDQSKSCHTWLLSQSMVRLSADYPTSTWQYPPHA